MQYAYLHSKVAADFQEKVGIGSLIMIRGVARIFVNN